MPEREPDQAAMVSFRPEDVLYGKLRPAGEIVARRRRGLLLVEFITMRPRPGIDSRWLGYLAQSNPFIEWSVTTSEEGVKMPRTG
ncbi:MAG: hypothetical protein WKF78_02765 [Candidatus Limnocylindrales bacterium]